MAFEFDGTSANRLETAGDFGILGAISCAAWLKVDAIDQTVKAVLTCHNWSNFNHHLALYGSAIRFSFYNSALRRYQSEASVVTPGQWHHVAVTYADGGTPVVYVDGVPVSGAWQVQSGVNALAAGGEPLCIGGAPRDSYRFDGQILEAAEWSRQLTADEIGQLCSGEIITRMPLTIHPDDLECYYPLDDVAEGATVTAARDVSGNGLDMTAMDTGILGRAARVMTLGAGAILVAQSKPDGIPGDVEFDRLEASVVPTIDAAIAHEARVVSASPTLTASWRSI